LILVRAHAVDGISSQANVKGGSGAESGGAVEEVKPARQHNLRVLQPLKGRDRLNRLKLPANNHPAEAAWQLRNATVKAPDF
jgi:hypothetical protein